MKATTFSKEWEQVLESPLANTLVRNDFHNSRAYMSVNIFDSTVTSSEVDRVAAELCGMSDCACHSVPMNGDRVVNAYGEEYVIIG